MPYCCRGPRKLIMYLCNSCMKSTECRGDDNGRLLKSCNCSQQPFCSSLTNITYFIYNKRDYKRCTKVSLPAASCCYLDMVSARGGGAVGRQDCVTKNIRKPRRDIHVCRCEEKSKQEARNEKIHYSQHHNKTMK